jgi:hypothetical protein
MKKEYVRWYVPLVHNPKTPNLPVSEEVLEALWMPLDVFLASDEVNVYYKSVVRSAIEHPESRLMNRAIRLKAPDAEIFF